MLTNENMHELMDMYSGYLMHISFMYVKDFATAEDIVQEVFISYFKGAEHFEGRATLKTYLTKMTIHKSTDYLRSWASRKRTMAKLFSQTKASYDFEMQLEESPLMATVLQLPLKYRECILLFYYEDMTTLEMAQFLSLSENTVKTRLRRARQLLKERTASVSWEEFLHE
jgi:RNA polymerase sigma factor (sigma-70 family)